MTMWERVRERKLVQWALAYLAGAWVLLEVAQMVGDAFGWPNVVQQGLIALVVVGLAATIVLAWYHGEKGRQRASGPELLMLSALFVLAAVSLTWIASNRAREVVVGGNAESTANVDGDSRGDQLAMASVLPALDLNPLESIAVLPFENLSPDPDHAFFALAVSDEITHALQQVSGLRVINRASATRYADSDRSIREIGVALGVSRVLSGSVQRQGNDVRILAQLMDADTEVQVWSDRYMQSMDDPFGVQVEIAERIASALEGEFDPAAERRIMAGGTESAAASELFVRARQVWFHDPWGPTSLRRAMGLMRSALDVDSTFSRARADLSSMYSDLATFDGYEMADSALAMAEQAVAEAPEMGDGYGALCYAQENLGYPADALANCIRAVELAPGSGDAQWSLANVLSGLGRKEEAIPWWEQAINSSPGLSGLRGAVGSAWASMGDSARAHAWYEERRRMSPTEVESELTFFTLYWDRGHFDAAEEALDRMAALDPDHWMVHRSRAEVQMVRGDAEAAVRSLLAYHEVENPRWDPPTLLAAAYQQAGNLARADSTVQFARGIAEQFMARGDQGHWIQRALATLETLAGRPDQAVRYLEQAVDKGYTGADQMWHDPLRRPLRGNPRFEALIARVREEDAARHARALRLTTFPDGIPPALGNPPRP